MAQEIIKEQQLRGDQKVSLQEEIGVKDQIAAQVTMALSTLDSRYKENVASYAQELHACTYEIETARISLELIEKEKQPHTVALLAIEKEIDHEARLLEHFTEQWVQKTVVISELEIEMKQLEGMQEKKWMFQNRYDDLKRLQLEIEDLELKLLGHELEKENIVLKMEPLEHKIRAWQKTIEELESKKRYIESSYLHRITEVAPTKQLMQENIPSIGR
jgi:chromosome segregation ATPase